MPKTTIDIFAEPENTAYLWIPAESKTVAFASAGDGDSSHLVVTIAALGVASVAASISPRVASMRDGNPASPSGSDPLLGTVDFVFINSLIYGPEEYYTSRNVLVNDVISDVLGETEFEFSGAYDDNTLIGHTVVFRNGTAFSVRYCVSNIGSTFVVDSAPDIEVQAGREVSFLATPTQIPAIKTKTDHLLDPVITGTVTDATPTTTLFKGDSALSSVDNFYCSSSKQILVFTSGALKGIGRKIVGYTGATRQFLVNGAFPAVPANGSTFMIVGLIE